MGKYTKTIIAALFTVLDGLQSAISNDVITSSEWVHICLMALATLGVYVAPNARQSEDVHRS